jgi:hypothetical protein
MNFGLILTSAHSQRNLRLQLVEKVSRKPWIFKERERQRFRKRAYLININLEILLTPLLVARTM